MSGASTEVRRRVAHWVWWRSPRTVLSIAVSATLVARSSLSKSTLSLPPCSSSPTCSSFCETAMMASSGAISAPSSCWRGHLEDHHRFTVIFDGACRFCCDCWSTGKLEPSGRMTQEMFPYSAQCLFRQWLHVHASRMLAGVFNASDNLGIPSPCQPSDLDAPVRTH